jgi:death-on-curing protein
VTPDEAPFDYLSVADLLEIAHGLIGAVVVRERGLLASAAERPRATVLGDDAYPTLAEKAAALMPALARNHAFDDGNKRLAWAATRIFCLLNDRDLAYGVDEAEALVQAVARGDVEAADIATSIERHLR